MDAPVDQVVKKCFLCRTATPKPSREPLKMTPLPDGPWQQVSIDFCEVAGLYVLVVSDDYSRFPEVEIVHSTSAKAVLPKLDRLFTAYGVPQVVKSDNSPPFNGHEFAQFADYLGFKHRRVTPLWPEANGAVQLPAKLSSNPSLYYWCRSCHCPLWNTNQDQAALPCCCSM